MNEVNVLSMLRHPNIIEYRESFLHERAMMIKKGGEGGGVKKAKMCLRDI